MPHLDRPGDQVFHLAGPVQRRVVGVDVQMAEAGRRRGRRRGWRFRCRRLQMVTMEPKNSLENRVGRMPPIARFYPKDPAPQARGRLQENKFRCERVSREGADVIGGLRMGPQKSVAVSQPRSPRTRTQARPRSRRGPSRAPPQAPSHRRRRHPGGHPSAAGSERLRRLRPDEEGVVRIQEHHLYRRPGVEEPHARRSAAGGSGWDRRRSADRGSRWRATACRAGVGISYRRAVRLPEIAAFAVRQQTQGRGYLGGRGRLEPRRRHVSARSRIPRRTAHSPSARTGLLR